MPVRAIKVWNAATSAWEDVGISQPDLSAYVATNTVDAAGDLIVGSGDNSVDRLPLGTNGQYLSVDTSGSGVNKVRWVSLPEPISPFLLMGA